MSGRHRVVLVFALLLAAPLTVDRVYGANWPYLLWAVGYEAVRRS